MPRSVVLVMGVILWASFAVFAAVHAIIGVPERPLVAGIVVTAVVVAWHMRRGRLKAS